MKAIYRSRWQGYLLLFPAVAMSLAFLYWPAIDTFRLSLYRTIAAGASSAYVGLDNFRRLLTSPDYHHSFGLSVLFAVVVVVGVLTVSVYLGFLVYKVSLGSSVYLVSSILTYSFSFTVIAVIMLMLLHPTVGIVTHLVERLFGVSLDWLSNDWQAFAVVSVTTMLKMIGYNVIFVVGALSSIPESLNETARLDGVGDLRMLARVYVPLISPTLAFLLIIDTVYAFFLPFPVIDIMTQGGPGSATLLLIYQLYQSAFAYSEVGYAAAQSVVLFVIVGGLMLVQLWLSDRYAHYGGG